MTEKKTYCFRWRCYHIQKAPPYKAVAFGGGEIHSITRSKAFRAAWRGALDDLKTVNPDSLSTYSDITIPILYRSSMFYRFEHHTDKFIYHIFVEDITK